MSCCQDTNGKTEIILGKWDKEVRELLLLVLADDIV